MSNELETSGGQDTSLPAPATPPDRKLQLAYFSAAAVPSTIMLDIMSQGQFGASLAIGAVLGGTAWYFAPELHKVVRPGLHIAGQAYAWLNRNNTGRTQSKLMDRNWWLGRETVVYAPDDQGEEEDEEAPKTEPGQAEQAEQAAAPQTTERDPLFQRKRKDDAGIPRLTLDQIIKNSEYNSYRLWIGRSMTDPEHKAVEINFYKQHFRFIGASQRGKSSMVAAFLTVVTRTHDPKHVRLILLDKENLTGKLFADLPHVLTMKKADGSQVKLHARDIDQVLEMLLHVMTIMEHRNNLSRSTVLGLPIILVYLEEFLAVKNELRARIAMAKSKEEADKAKSDFTTFVYCIGQLCQLGLKQRVQLLLCAQVEYADDDFKEALASVGCGFSFCVAPDAARAAGFMNTKYLNQNAKDNKVGQAVVETPDCQDIILSPEFDLEARLLECELFEEDDDEGASVERRMRPDGEPAHSEFDARTTTQSEAILTLVRRDDQEEDNAQENGVRPGVEPAHTAQNDAYPKLNATQITIFAQAYEMSGNIDKSLSFAKADTRYREHARVIIRELGLKKKEA